MNFLRVISIKVTPTFYIYLLNLFFLISWNFFLTTLKIALYSRKHQRPILEVKIQSFEIKDYKKMMQKNFDMEKIIIFLKSICMPINQFCNVIFSL